MNLRQEIALYLSVAALVATWLFPPWIFWFTATNGHTYTTVWIKYHFIFDPASSEPFAWHYILLSDLIIIAVGASIVYALRTRS